MTAAAEVAAAAQVTSPVVDGPAQVRVAADGLHLTGAGTSADIRYDDVLSITLDDVTIRVDTRGGPVTLSRLGYQTQAICRHMVAAYHAQVREALFARGEPVLRAEGAFRYRIGEEETSGRAAVEVFENCVLVLPPDLGARRVPLAFASPVVDVDYRAVVDVGDDRFEFERLGYHHEAFVGAVRGAQQRIHESAVAALHDLDPGLDEATAHEAAALLPEGAAAPLGQLRTVAPSLADALQARIARGRAADSFATFLRVCDPDQICVGFKRAASTLTRGLGAPGAVNLLQGLLGNVAPDEEAGDGAAADYVLWIVAPSWDLTRCAVEFAEPADEAAATFVYRVDREWTQFRRHLNLALEAIGFHRDVVRLDEARLMAPEHARYRMAVERNASLRLVRGALVGRIVHASADSWRRGLQEAFEHQEDVTDSHPLARREHRGP